MADKIPTGRTGESKVASPKEPRIKIGQVTIYHGGATEYMGSPVWTDEAGRRHVGPKPKATGGGRGGGGGGGY
jgi:hypothetical protein